MDGPVSSPYRKRVVGIAALHSEEPDPRWDTLELLLECRHTHAVQRFHVGTVELVPLDSEFWKGRALPCRKCVTKAAWRLRASA